MKHKAKCIQSGFVQVLTLASLFTHVACVTPYRLTDREVCSNQNMRLVGVTTTQTTTNTNTSAQGFGTFNTSNGTTGNVTSNGYANSTATSTSRSISCGQVRNFRDQVAIAEDSKVIQNKADYNKTIWWKNVIVGTGYLAFIVPGIVGYVMFEHVLAPNPYDVPKESAQKKPQQKESVVTESNQP